MKTTRHNVRAIQSQATRRAGIDPRRNSQAIAKAFRDLDILFGKKQPGKTTPLDKSGAGTTGKLNKRGAS